MQLDRQLLRGHFSECANISLVLGKKIMTIVITCIILEHTIMVVNSMMQAYNYQ